MNTTTSHLTALNSTPVIKPIYRSWDFWDVSLLLLLIFGLIGNLLSIIVMSRKRMRNTNAFLFVTSMAVSDCLFLIFKFTSNMIKMYQLPIFSACIFIHNVLPHTTLFISVWLIIITSLERTVAVLSPFRVAILFSHSRCKYLIATMCLFFFALSNSTTPCLEYYESKPHFCVIKGGHNGTCFHYFSYVYPWIKAALGAWIPSVLGIVLNALIVRGLFAASRARQNIVNEAVPLRHYRSSLGASNAYLSRSNQNLCVKNQQLLITPIESYPRLSSSASSPAQLHTNNSKEKQITIMLMAISVSFMILSFPYSFYELLRRLQIDVWLFKHRGSSRFVIWLLDINHATNFILYCVTGQKFRTELKNLMIQLFCPKRYVYEHKQNVSQMTSLVGNIQLKKLDEKNFG